MKIVMQECMMRFPRGLVFMAYLFSFTIFIYGIVLASRNYDGAVVMSPESEVVGKYTAAALVNGTFDPSVEVLEPLPGLADGWIGGRLVDRSDEQYDGYRSNFISITLLFAIYLGLSHLLRRNVNYSNFRLEDSLTHPWVNLMLCYGILMAVLLHGVPIVWLFAIVLLCYYFMKFLGRNTWSPYVIIVFTFPFFFLGYILRFDSILGENFTFLDEFMVRTEWWGYTRMTIVRIISWAFDYHWMLVDRPSSGKKELMFVQIESHLPARRYNMIYYLAYLFYPPLYFAGPIVTFNCFVNQIYVPQNAHGVFYTVIRLVESAVSLILCELSLHYLPCNAILHEKAFWLVRPAWEMAFILGHQFNFMYMKFLSIWRHARMFALLDGINTWDNLPRCVNTNYDFQVFWRNWHASLYRWIFRYLYLTLGGRKVIFITVWVIYFYIAAFHDFSWGWINWAMSNAGFLLVEVAVTIFLKSIMYPIIQTPLWMFLAVTFMCFGLIACLFSQTMLILGWADTLYYYYIMLSDPNAIKLVGIVFPMLTSMCIVAWERDLTRAEDKIEGKGSLLREKTSTL